MSITTWRRNPALHRSNQIVVRQPVIAHRAVVAFDVGILVLITRLYESNLDAALLCPSQREGTNVFRPVIAPDRLRCVVPFDDLFERPDDTFGWQREIDMDAQAFPVAIINHIEQADAASIGQLVMHEVH